jgi:hypothetical protein
MLRVEFEIEKPALQMGATSFLPIFASVFLGSHKSCTAQL